MSRITLIFVVLIFDVCFSTNCQSQLSTMASLNERMTQMLNNLYSSPLLAGCAKKPKTTPSTCTTDATPTEQPPLIPTPICPYTQSILGPQYSIPQYANLPNPQVIYVSAIPGTAGLSVPTIPGIPVSDNPSIPMPSTQYSAMPVPHGYTLPAAPSFTYATTSIPNTPQSPSTQIPNAPQNCPYSKPQQPATQTEYQLSNNCPKPYVSTQPATYVNQYNPNTVTAQPQCPTKLAQPLNQPQPVPYSYPSNHQVQTPQILPQNPYPAPSQPRPEAQTRTQNTAVASISQPSTCHASAAPVHPQGNQVYHQTAQVYAGQAVPTYPHQEAPASYYV